MTKRNREKVLENRKNKKKEKGRVIDPKFQDEVKSPVQAKTAAQKQFLTALANYDVVVFEAPAGCGKTFITMSEVTDWLKKGTTDKIVLSRPAVGMGNSIGLLKGDLREKFEYYLMPLISVLKERYGASWYENNLSSGKLMLLPLEYVRGMSIDDGVYVIDEAQLTKPDEMYTLLTRMGENGKLIVLGDRTQNDLGGRKTGIEWLTEFVENHSEVAEYVKIIRATSDDIVRGGLCKATVKAKEKDLSV